MILKTGNMWDRFGEVDLFCITINGTFKADGSLVMGIGIAKSATYYTKGLAKNATHGQLFDEYDVTKEQEFAITMCANEMEPDEMVIRLMNLQDGMKGKEILEVMRA